MSEEVRVLEDGLAEDSDLRQPGWSKDDANTAALSLEEAFEATVALDTVSAEAMDAVMGVSPLPVYRRYQARGVTRKVRNKSNIYGITIHTPEGYESGTLSVLNGTRAGFDAYLPLNGRFYPCNNIGAYYTWHSGHNWGNPYCIGVEQGDFAAKSGGFGDAHYGRLARLCAYYCEIFDLNPKQVYGAKPGIMSHASLTPAARTDPGEPFKWDQLQDLIADYLRGTGSSPKPTPKPTPGKTLYRVRLDKALPKGEQLGAYAEKSNADAHKATLARYNIPVNVAAVKTDS